MWGYHSNRCDCGVTIYSTYLWQSPNWSSDRSKLASVTNNLRALYKCWHEIEKYTNVRDLECVYFKIFLLSLLLPSVKYHFPHQSNVNFFLPVCSTQYILHLFYHTDCTFNRPGPNYPLHWTIIYELFCGQNTFRVIILIQIKGNTETAKRSHLIFSF